MWSSKDSLKRLELYRKSNNIIQSDLAMSLGITQDRYSYMESGSTKLSGEYLIKLADCGFDIDYIITGESYSVLADSIDSIIDSFKADADRDFVLKMLAEIMLKKLEEYKKEFSCEEALQISLLKHLVNEWNDFTMLGFIREEKEYSQSVMAQKLGVGLKKYRELEREEKYPDIDNLQSICEILPCQPSLFFNINDRKMIVIKNVWQLLEKEDRQKVLLFIENLSSYM